MHMEAGFSRLLISTAGSNLFASACAAPFPGSPSGCRARMKSGTEAWHIEMVISFLPWVFAYIQDIARSIQAGGFKLPALSVGDDTDARDGPLRIRGVGSISLAPVATTPGYGSVSENSGRASSQVETQGTQDTGPTGAKGIYLLDKNNERANAAEVGESAPGYLASFGSAHKTSHGLISVRVISRLPCTTVTM